MSKTEMISAIIDVVYKISMLIWVIVYTKFYIDLRRELTEIEMTVYKQAHENLIQQKRINVLEESLETKKRGKRNASEIKRKVNKKNDTVK